MRRPISLKVYSIALGLLVLMVVVTGLSARNLRILNNEVAALAGDYVPLDQQSSRRQSASLIEQSPRYLTGGGCRARSTLSSASS